jgi:CRISPR type IV-associated protein Csf3
MSAFIVRITLNTPVILNPVLTLDGLLARLAFDLSGDAEAAIGGLPLERTGPIHKPIHKASHLFAEGPAPATPVNMVRMVRPGKTLTADMVRPQRAGKKIANVMIHRGDFKSLMDGYTARMPRALWAFGRGDAGAVEAALAQVKAIGKKRAQGWGEIGRIDVEAVEADERFGLMTADGLPARAVPWPLWREIGGREDVTTTMAKTGFPRWAVEAEFCAVPTDEVVGRDALRGMLKA